jgi:hypothetical protein
MVSDGNQKAMIDDTYRARWAWLVGSLASVSAVALACSANDTADPDDDDGGGGSMQGGSAGSPTGGVATGGVGPTGGVSGTGGPGGTGSGGVSGAAPTGGVGPTGGVSGASTGGAPGGVGGTPATGGAAGTGTSGTGGGGATLVEPIQRGNTYVLEFGDLYFEVNPAGARIVNVHLTGGQNLLTDATINSTNFGSTFWTSPQAEWNPNWPPVPEIDSGAYTPNVASPSVSFLGSPATRIPARVAKTFRADLQRTAVVAEYSLQATAAKGYAPWEITRVFKRGLTFWPTGTAPRAGGTMAIAPTTDAATCTWHDAATPTTVDQKLFANASAGWIAHVDGDIVIVKKFQDIAANQAAPGEDEIELYVSGSANYIEVEQQGAYQMLAQGADFTWTVTWFVKRLPAGVTATVGNQQLVSFVQSLVQ